MKLPAETQRLWDRLRTEKLLHGAILVGGAALTLKIGHRISEDLDFAFPTLRLPRKRIEMLMDRLRQEKFKVERNDDPSAWDEFERDGMDLHDHQQDWLVNDCTKLSFFTLAADIAPFLPTASRKGPRVAEASEIFLLKSLLTADRSKSRDWLDLYVLMTEHGFTAADFANAFAKVGRRHGVDIGWKRLCSGSASPEDPGYESLMDRPPSRRKLKSYFIAERSKLERDLARQAAAARKETS